MAPSATHDANGDVVAALIAALATGTREAFTAMLTDDVRWGGEQRGAGNECINRDQAGQHYAELLDAGVKLRINEFTPTDPAGGGDVFTVLMQIRSPDPDDFPPEMAVRLTLRAGLISDICVLDTPPTIEVLYLDGCPSHEAFLPHLRDLLAAHGITAPLTLVRVATDDDAQSQRFLGSPTLRVDGRDVDPAVADGAVGDTGDPGAGVGYGMRCRLYATPHGLARMPTDQWILDALIENPVHEAAISAIRSGDVSALRVLLAEHPELATTRLARHDGRTALHIATDWPGHFPNVAATIAALVAAGADPNAGCLGEHPETPLHWAASSDDIAAVDALLDAGADINAPGAVIGGGTAMADATAFGQWDAARRLHERGATTTLFDAAALGLAAEVRRHLTANHLFAEDITSSFWGACHGGHVDTAAILLDHGADINWLGYDDLTPLDAARRSGSSTVVTWLRQRSATSAEDHPATLTVPHRT